MLAADSDASENCLGGIAERRRPRWAVHCIGALSCCQKPRMDSAALRFFHFRTVSSHDVNGTRSLIVPSCQTPAWHLLSWIWRWSKESKQPKSMREKHLAARVVVSAPEAPGPRDAPSSHGHSVADARSDAMTSSDGKNSWKLEAAGKVNEFVRVLRRRAGGAGPSLTLSQDTISPGFRSAASLWCSEQAQSLCTWRLVASNFGGPHGGRQDHGSVSCKTLVQEFQEIAIFEGDEHTGVIDSILRPAGHVELSIRTTGFFLRGWMCEFCLLHSYSRPLDRDALSLTPHARPLIRRVKSISSEMCK